MFIFRNLLSIIDTLIYDIDPLIHIKNKRSNSMRHFWSTFENVTFYFFLNLIFIHFHYALI